MGGENKSPRLLVKMVAPPPGASLSLQGAGFTLTPLFQSIEPAQPQGFQGGGPARWHILTGDPAMGPVNAWDLCHDLMTGRGTVGLTGVPAPEFAEPDLEQRWIYGGDAEQALAMSRTGDTPTPPDSRLPTGDGFYWFRNQFHSELELAWQEIGQPPDRVRIAHFDTGFDPGHITKPIGLNLKLQKNFVDADRPDDATDRSSGLMNNLGHGTGTLSLLAGNLVEGVPLGGAPYLEVVPVRVANSVVLFKNSGIAQAFDYVHSLCSRGTFIDVITMSMGGLASQAWAEAVNALYDMGVFIVTAAGNNYGNLPTHNIVYPARFKRVIAACGVMADGSPYADLPIKLMAGNYGPQSKMDTALAGYTPNTPWARIGSGSIVDHDGRGTSAATPQVAASAALWIQKNRTLLQGYDGWARVEAVRHALFETARLENEDLREKLGRGIIRAKDALAQAPAQAAALSRQPADTASFPFLRVLTGLGIAAEPDARHRMLQLEALQLSQQYAEIGNLLPDPEVDPNQLEEPERHRIAEALLSAPNASRALRSALSDYLSVRRPQAPVSYLPAASDPIDQTRLQRAASPTIPPPVGRSLRVFAFDPLLGMNLETKGINETVLKVRWEEGLQPGPVGEYLEVVDVDPGSGCCYAPVDLNTAAILSRDGLTPAEGNPQFHQQMSYAIAMKTIEHFEKALGRRALWAPRPVQQGKPEDEEYVGRLRIYPHALREANSYYSPSKSSLLFGYFPASPVNPGGNLPGGIIFCCLSHDIVAHETTHALLDGLHRHYREATSPDAPAFHEAFADIVALFQHFTVPEALREQIRRTRGDLGRQNLLGELAQQFGQGIGHFGALRSAIGRTVDGRWEPVQPSRTDYNQEAEAHDLGAVLVAAVFSAFLDIYRTRSADLIRLATGGTGVLPPGSIPEELVNRLAMEASKTAHQVLNICIRALDYCPPMDITFGDYLRALITADRDLVPSDPLGYRVAFISAFAKRGIYPKNVRNLSVDSLIWERPEVELPGLAVAVKNMNLGWDLHLDRESAYKLSKENAKVFQNWLAQAAGISDNDIRGLGFIRASGETELNGVKGELSPFEVHSVRPARRIGPNGEHLVDLVIEITQCWTPHDEEPRQTYRGGCTLLLDLEQMKLRYSICKRVAHPARVSSEKAYRARMSLGALWSNYYGDISKGAEPFAMRNRMR